MFEFQFGKLRIEKIILVINLMFNVSLAAAATTDEFVWTVPCDSNLPFIHCLLPCISIANKFFSIRLLILASQCFSPGHAPYKTVCSFPRIQGGFQLFKPGNFPFSVALNFPDYPI